MKKIILTICICLSAFLFNNAIAQVYQTRNNLPLFIEHFHINPIYVKRISRFRSLIGHAYPPCKPGYNNCFSDPNYFQYRNCESDKHYYDLTDMGYQKLPDIYAPCNGTIAYVRWEQDDNHSMGYQIGISVANEPEYMVILFHVTQTGLNQGDPVKAGRILGTHATEQTMSDVAVLNTQTGSYSSVFSYMTDDVLQQFGLNSDNLDAIIISEQQREQYQSICNNPYDPLPPYNGPETPPENWFQLQ